MTAFFIANNGMTTCAEIVEAIFLNARNIKPHLPIFHSSFKKFWRMALYAKKRSDFNHHVNFKQ